MSPRQVFGVAAAACIACCIGAVVGLVSAIGALGLAATMVVGIVGMAVSAAVILGVIVARGRRSRRRVVIEPVAVELTRSR